MAKVIAVIILAGLVGLIWFVGQKIVPSRPELVHHHATPVAEPPPKPEPPIRDVIAEESKRPQPAQPPRTPFWTHTHGGPIGPPSHQPPPHPAAQTLPQHHIVPVPAPRPRVIIRYRIKRMKCPVVPAYLPRELNQVAPPPAVMDDETWWRLHPRGY